MDSFLVFVGQDIKKGDAIGLSGNSGCVPDHLHYSAARLTNTANKLEETLVFTDEGTTMFQGQSMKVNVHSNLYDFAIDPFGWEPINGPDPWGWRPYRQGVGAMSIRLWTWKQPSSW
jgi:murein DD-endopeptidase MepM/ murein hydrolase activator NlpD